MQCFWTFVEQIVEEVRQIDFWGNSIAVEFAVCHHHINSGMIALVLDEHAAIDKHAHALMTVVRFIDHILRFSSVGNIHMSLALLSSSTLVFTNWAVEDFELQWFRTVNHFEKRDWRRSQPHVRSKHLVIK